MAGNRHGLAFLLLVAISSFLAGLLTYPLSSFAPGFCSKFHLLPSLTSPPPSPDWSSSDLASFRSSCSPPIPLNSTKSFILHKIFDGVSPFLDFPPDFAKPHLRDKRLEGWGSTDSVFARLIQEVQPRIILELGTFLGASAIHMVTTAKSLLSHEVLIICVDDFRGWPGLRDEFTFPQVNGDVQLLYQFVQNVQVMNLTENIIPMPFSTTAAMSALCEWGALADLIEVDAAHDFHSAWSDINIGYSLLRPGGVIFGHDYYNKFDRRGVGRAVDLFAKIKGLRVEPDGQHWIVRERDR